MTFAFFFLHMALLVACSSSSVSRFCVVLNRLSLTYVLSTILRSKLCKMLIDCLQNVRLYGNLAPQCG